MTAVALWRSAEAIVARLGRHWIYRGTRGGGGRGAALLGHGAMIAASAAVAAALLGLALWSFAATWRFPAAVPDTWSLATWTRAGGELGWPFANTLVAALAATIVATLLVVACLENEQRRGLRPGKGVLWLLYAPLLIPQTAFLFGVQVALVRLGLDGTLLAVIWSHLLFVLPYVFLSLADPWRALDRRFVRTAACLGASPGRVLVAVKLPILLRPILIAMAVGFATSVGQYLPTLFAGAGRVATLTTEAVTLAAGADRRILATYALAQAALPLVAYGLALAVPAIVFRHRRGLRGAS